MHLSTEHEKIHITKYLWSAPRLYISFSSVINGLEMCLCPCSRRGLICVVLPAWLHYITVTNTDLWGRLPSRVDAEACF